MSELHKACERGDLKEVTSLLSSKNINVINREGETPLFTASKHGHLNTVKVLTSRKECNFNILDDKGNTPLHSACKYGHHSIVQFLVADQRCQLNTQNRLGKTPLHLACRYGHLNTVNYLTSSCDLSIADQKGNTPLHSACKYGHHLTVEFLVADQRCQLNIQNKMGKSPLHLASRYGHRDTVKDLTSREECNLNIVDQNGNTPLHIACKQGHHSTVEFLVADQRCQLNTQNSELNTPLHIACHMKALCIIKLLLQKKCSTNIPNKEGETADEIAINEDRDCLLHIACQWGDMAIVTYLITDQRCNLSITNASKFTCLHTASKLGNLDVIKILVSRRECDINIPDDRGNTPLHIASKFGHHSVLQFFTAESDLRCQLNTQNKEGETPLYITCRYGHLNTFKVLTSRKGCNINVPDEHGYTPLHTACLYRHDSIVHFLAADCRCQLNTHDQDGGTPLHVASEHGDLETVKVFTSREECNLNILDELGNTPIHTACRYGHHSTVKFLIADQRCQANTQNMEGETPLHIASDYDDLDTVKVLLNRKECNFNIADKKGNTPLHRASKYGRHFVVEFLTAEADLRCQINTQNGEGETPLYLASKHGRLDTVKVLLSRKECDINITDGQGNTPLHAASKCGHQSVVQFLSAESYLLCQLNTQNRVGETPLYLASKHGHLDTVKVLLSRKECDFNITDGQGNTPLHAASKYGRHSVVEFLIVELGLKNQLNTHNREGESPLHLAIASKYGCLSTVNALLHWKECSINIANQTGNTPLHIACSHGHHSIVRFLVNKKRCRLNTKNSEMNTPLHIACYSKALRIIIILLGRKICNVKVPNKKGETAERIPLNEDGDCLLHIACQWGDAVIVTYLVTHEMCNQNIANASGSTPLHTAIKHGHLDVVKVLVSRKECDLNIPDESGITPLHLACLTQNLGIVNIFQKRCSTNITNKKGETAQEIPLNEDGDYLLHVACQWGDVDIIKYLVTNQKCDPNILNKHHLTPLLATIKQGEEYVATALLQHAKCDLSLRDQDGNTALHLACIRGQTEPEMAKVAKNLIISADPLCVNSAGQTPIELTTNYELIQAISHFAECKTKHSVQTYINLFFVGNPETGKSTLIKAICKEASISWKFLPKELRRVKNVLPHTAGIIPTTFRSNAFGNTVLYDLAGQIEYYTSHAAVIQTTVISTPPAFIIVVNMSESEEKISETLRYWWSFINNHAARASAPPQVILVGSHADTVKARRGNVEEKMSQVSTLLKRLPTSFYFAGQIALDCRDPASRKLQLFCSLVNKSCCELRQTADVDLHCHVLYAFLLEKFPGKVACTVSDIATIIQESDALLPQNPDVLMPHISTLSDKGLLLLVKDSVSSEDSWVILQKQALLGEINGTIFAPIEFSQHKKYLSTSTGVVPLLNLKCEFPDYNPAMIAKFLTHLEFCFKIDDHETLQLLKDEIVHEEDMPQSLSEEYYFFPALVSVENPSKVWEQDDIMISQCGWFYRCSRHDQFLTTQFLHVLILRLAFSFALQLHPGNLLEDSLALHRRCSVWKRGIGWLNRVPIEAVVEVGLLNQSVIVMMRCPKGEEAKCAQLHSEVIQKVLEAKDEHCKAVKMSESFIHPTDIKYPFIEHTEDLKYYSLTEIAIATVKEADNVLDYRGRNPFPVKDLLFFDPQTTTSRELLRELFSEKHSLDEQVRGQVLELLEGEAVL